MLTHALVLIERELLKSKLRVKLLLCRANSYAISYGLVTMVVTATVKLPVKESIRGR